MARLTDCLSGLSEIWFLLGPESVIIMVQRVNHGKNQTQVRLTAAGHCCSTAFVSHQFFPRRGSHWECWMERGCVTCGDHDFIIRVFGELFEEWPSGILHWRPESKIFNQKINVNKLTASLLQKWRLPEFHGFLLPPT